MLAVAVITNFGKAWLESMALRLAHPQAATVYSIDPRMEQSTPGSLALWVILIKDVYFSGGGPNPDHSTLSLIHAQGAGAASVIGLGSHNSDNEWYTGNAAPLGVGVTGFPTGPNIDNTGDQATIPLFAAARQLTFQGVATYPFTAGGLAFCLSNANGVPGVDTVAGNTQVFAIHEFGTPSTVTVTSSGQILTLTGGNGVLSEA